MTHIRRLPRSLPQTLVLALCLSFALLSGSALAGEKADKVAGLGLSFAQAAAENKSMAAAAESVAKDEASDWLLGKLGGLSAFKDVNKLNELNEKVNEITGMIETVQNLATQLGSGSYDQALITSGDAIVGKLNNPAVSAVWAAAKLTYESHQLVQSTGAARDIEALYGLVENDRRIIGEVSADAPAQINVNTQTVDYFFNDYLITNASGRALVKSYVTTVLGQEWPEQTWSQYLLSVRAMGSGMDTKAADELAALKGEFENVARGWIRSLLVDVNKQAMLRYQETRLRQENAKFTDYVQRMQRFVGGDLKRLTSLYSAKESANQRLPQLQKVLEEKQALFGPTETSLRAAMAETKEDKIQSAYTTLTDSTRPLWDTVATLNRAAESAAQADDPTVFLALQAEAGRWGVLLNDVRNFLDQAETKAEQVQLEDEADRVKSTIEANEFRAKVVAMRRERGTLPDPRPDYLQQLPLDDGPQMKAVLALVKRFPLETGEVLVLEAEQAILKQLNQGDFAAAHEELNNAAQRISGQMKAHYDAIKAELEAMKDTNRMVYAGYTALSKYEGPDKQWLSEAVARLGKLHEPFVELSNNVSAKWSTFSEFMGAMHTHMGDKFWEKGVPSYPLETHTFIGKFTSVDSLQDVPHALRMQVQTLWSQQVPDSALDYETQRLEASRSHFEKTRSFWNSRNKTTGEELSSKDIDYLKVFYPKVGEEDVDEYVRKAVASVKNDLAQWDAALDKWAANIRNFKQAARTNNANLQQDAEFLAPKQGEMEQFVFRLSQHELMLRSDDRGQLSPYVILNPAGEGAVMEPYPHYMNASELAEYGQKWLDKLHAYKEWDFIAKYFPGVVKWAQQASAMGHVTPAGDENILYKSKPLYLKDVEKAVDKAGGLNYKDGERWIKALDEIAKLIPQSLNRSTKNWYSADPPPSLKDIAPNQPQADSSKEKTTNDWYYADPDLKLENDALRGSETGKAYAKLLELLDESITMRANYLEAQRNAAGAAERDAATKAAQDAELAESYDLAAQSMFYVSDVRLNTRAVTGLERQITVSRDELDNGRIRVTARLSEIEGVEAMLLSLDNGRTWDEMKVARDIGFEFLPAAGQRYEFVLRLKRGPGKDDVYMKLLQDAWLVYENVDYNQLVLNAVKELAEAYEAQSAAAFGQLISRDYLGNRAFLEEGVRFDFDMFSAIQLKIFVNRIDVRKGFATVETKWDKKQIPRSTGQQQTTTGRTTMTFVPEDGVMKISNMRGNLLYATLSPEIAEASGLSQTVVDQIRTARDERTAVQPGAGDTEDSGGISGGSISVQTASITADTVPPSDAIDFENGAQSEPPSGSSDLGFEGALLWSQNTSTIQEVGASFSGLTTAPTSGYVAFGGEAIVVGKVYAFMTTEGLYGKMEITGSTDLGGGTFKTTIRYAVQSNGTTNLRTN